LFKNFVVVNVFIEPFLMKFNLIIVEKFMIEDELGNVQVQCKILWLSFVFLLII